MDSMTNGLRHLPIGSTASVGFVTNLVWEVVQCPFLYDMTDWGFWKGAIYMAGAIVGDVFIVLGVVGISWLLQGGSTTALLVVPGWLTTITVGLVAGILLEWLARVLNLWTYSALMPTVSVVGEDVGLAPAMQIAFLPALSLFLAVRFQDRATGEQP